MKKTILALTAALATAFGASAADYTHSFIINKVDGSTVEYQFQDEPVITISEDNFLVRLVSSPDDGVLYPMADVVNITFDKQVGVQAIEGDTNHVTFGISRETLDVAGLAPGADIYIYNTAGSLCIKAVCNADGAASVNISSLGSGVFVVNAGGNAFKFIR